MKLYSHPFSQHARRGRMLAAELGQLLEEIPVALDKGEHRTEEFLRMNPNGKIPVLVDGPFALAESHAIMRYLASRSGSAAAGRLYPQDPARRARVDMWLDWNHTRLNPPVQTLAIQTLVMGDRADRDIVARCREESGAAMEVLDAALRQLDDFTAALTLADLSVSSTVAPYALCGGAPCRHQAVGTRTPASMPVFTARPGDWRRHAFRGGLSRSLGVMAGQFGGRDGVMPSPRAAHGRSDGRSCRRGWQA